MTVAAVVVLATAACSSIADDGGSSVIGEEPDPVTTFCADWVRFDALTNSDDDPTAQLVRDVVDLQDEMEVVLPDGLESEWASILEWNRTFIEYYETAGYRQPSDEVIFDLLGGEDAAVVAGQDREDAYLTIQSWSRRNCPSSSDATFCDLWPAYDTLIESDSEPTEEMIAQLLEMEEEIDGVLPPELTSVWAGIVDWNQAFIDVFEQVGYGPITDETYLQAFGGDEAAAGAAGEALEAGFATIRNWTDERCGPVVEDNIAFCSALPEFTTLTSDEDSLTQEQYEEALAVIDRVGIDVPVAVRGDWDAVVESAQRFYDVLVSVGFRSDRIDDDLLEQAFGSVEEAVAIEEAGDAAQAALEEWSLTGCGDFCTRWPDLRRALDETGTELWWVRDGGEEYGETRMVEYLRAFEIGSQLVPDGIREPWDLAVAARRDWIEWWESFDYDGEQWESPETRRRGFEIMREATYLTTDSEFVDFDAIGLGRDQRRVIAAWQGGVDSAPSWLLNSDEFAEHEHNEIASWLAGEGEHPEWVFEYWRRSPGGWVNGQLTAAIDGWVNANCEAITGRPGTVRVRFPKVEGAAGDTLVLAVMEKGAAFEDLSDPSSVLAGTCGDIQTDPWGVWRDEHGREERWESEEFGADRWEGSPFCDYRWEDDPARLDAGNYTMLAAIIGGRPSIELLGAPSACLAFDVRIDGDTVIDVPDLPSCDANLGDSDDPWRNPPSVDPSTPGAGTLQIVFPDLIGDEHGGQVQIVVLPGDTTLNDVGREQVWPVGATQTWLISPGETEQEGQEWLTGEVNVPVAELPASGSPRSLEPHWLAERPPADRLPLAILAPGTYDVHVQLSIHDPPEADETESVRNDRCVSFEVTIAGDIVVDLPELGECPRVP